MIIAGDVALGQKGMRLTIPEELTKKPWLVNLEGSLVKDGERYISINGVFNDYSAIQELQSRINLSAVSLANNHILDAEPMNVSLANLKELGLPSIGVGNNLKEAGNTVEIGKYTFISFGWECIECPQAGENKEGVNPYNKEHVLGSVRQMLHEGKKVICFFHWNYEFELYPQPYDRELAHQLIDEGVYAVIGAHAHRVQHIEMYKGHPIVYGLGNFMFSRKTFFNHRLDFGDRSKEEIAFEIKEDGTFAVHKFEYSHENNEVKYIGSETLLPESRGNATYENMTSEQYVQFFKKNRSQKKLLPIFYYNDSTITYSAKCKFIALRGWALSQMVKIGAKSQER